MRYELAALIALAMAATWPMTACEDPEDKRPGDEEVCDNGIDDDGDDLIDCDDDDCADDAYCAGEALCDDGEDDDGDGLVDCDDPDCASDPSCSSPSEVCDNGTDDDGDGATDCDDTDCATASNCQGPSEICDNGIDDDGDGATDCGDDGCEGDPACLEDCANSVDDDDDGLIDCLDPSCDFDPSCAELCNGVDDDGDGLIDENPTDAEVGTSCYDGPAAAAGVGQCDEGTIECFGGELLCIGWVAPLAVELCDGIDNDCDGTVPASEVSVGCRAIVIPGELSRIEVQTQIRDVDVHVNLDTTGSMSGALDTLRTNLSSSIVPGIRDILPTAEFGVSTFDDFPLGDFGSLGDRPFDLHQRVTANVPMVQDALDRLVLHGGSDNPEAGLESLFQIATGDGTTWPGEPWIAEVCDNYLDDDGDELHDCDDPDCVGSRVCAETSWPWELCQGGVDEDLDGYTDCDDPDCSGDYSCDYVPLCPYPAVPGFRSLTTGAITPSDVDAYSITVPLGGTLVVDIDAESAGSPLNATLNLYDQADLEVLATDTSACGWDPRLAWKAPEASDVVVEVSGADAASAGWYAMHVTIDGVESVATPDTCLALEVGGSSVASGIFAPSLAVPLAEASTQYPAASAGACLIDCGRELAAAEADLWAERFCSGPPSVSTCGSGSIDPPEQCDDGNRTSGDGCDWACRLEVPPPVCGDGSRDPGEQCDDGDLFPGDGCDAFCVLEPGCGNGRRDLDEACDDGNSASGDGCSSTCEIEVSCGDGFRAASEQCDDGNLSAGDGCDSACALEPGCGNGLLDEGETCDDGNTTSGDGCDGACAIESYAGVPAFDWTAGYDPGLGHGSIGGVGFRETALPVIVHITDAPSHDCDDYTDFDPAIDAHCAADTFYELGAIGARVVAVTMSPGDDPADLTMPLGMASVTGAVVPPCAFDSAAARFLGTCDEGECCTGINGAGIPPDAGGDCPLVFQIDWYGAGLDESIISSIDTLTQFVRYDLTASPRDDPSDDVDARCFVESIGIVGYDGPPGSCAVDPSPVDTDGDGLDDTLANATPRTRVTFEVNGVNEDVNDVDGDGDRTEACAGAGSYGLFLDVVAEGGTVVASRRVVVEVE